MSRYNSNYGSHDQLQDLRKLNMEVMRERDALKKLVEELYARIEYELTLNVIAAEIKVAEQLKEKFTL